MKHVYRLPEFRAELTQLRLQEKRIALVPTMGALHEGHLSLLDVARAHADAVAVTIFVNPTQFGPNEDFSRYPRTLEQDAALLKKAGADVLFSPDVADMYPDGFATSVHVEGVSEGLCGAFRPGHFDGVATVVSKLLLRALPDVAVFGEKDFQQLAVIRRMALDLDIPVRIVGAPTCREEDGLAMSSRNRYLTDSERRIAPRLYALLNQVAAAITGGADVVSTLTAARQQLLDEGFDKLDYLELCDAANLQPIQTFEGNARLLAAVWLGTTRLIDNISVGG